MSLLRDLVEKDMRSRTGPPCSIRSFLEGCEPDVASDLLELLEDQSVTGAAIWRGLKQLGYTNHEGTVSRHRNGRCGCGRTR